MNRIESVLLKKECSNTCMSSVSLYTLSIYVSDYKGLVKKMDHFQARTVGLDPEEIGKYAR